MCPGPSPYMTSGSQENMPASFHHGFLTCPFLILTQGNATMKVACYLFQLDHKYKHPKRGVISQRQSTCLTCIRFKVESLVLRNTHTHTCTCVHTPQNLSQRPREPHGMCSSHTAMLFLLVQFQWLKLNLKSWQVSVSPLFSLVPKQSGGPATSVYVRVLNTSPNRHSIREKKIYAGCQQNEQDSCRCLKGRGGGGELTSEFNVTRTQFAVIIPINISPPLNSFQYRDKNSNTRGAEMQTITMGIYSGRVCSALPAKGCKRSMDMGDLGEDREPSRN